ncbi:hypothetical protein QZH41_018959 [Actinostola sp. cb2023]|nr:hypothetical protein QZH41_018959 [Actinostola sp. cb2023]
MSGDDTHTGPPLRSRPSSYDYFDIDDVIATQDRIPCKLEVQIHNLGFLDPSSQGEHLAAGSKLELPYWLAKELCSRRRRVVSVELPKVYKDGYREILKADAGVVDLHKYGPHFYDIGTKLMHFDDDENSLVIRTLQETFIKRFRKIMDSSQNSPNEDTSALTSRLDHTEQQIFAAGKKGIREFLLWEAGQMSKLTTSETVISHRKRKRAAID